MEDDITVGVQLLLEDGISDTLATIMQQLAAADQAIAVTSAKWDGLVPGKAAQLSPVPISTETPATTSPDSTALDFDSPDGPGSPPEQAPIAAPTVALVPRAPLDGHPLGPEATRASFAPVPPDFSGPSDAWAAPPTLPSDLGNDPAPAFAPLPSVPVDRDYGLPVQPSALSTPPVSLPILSAAPIPPEDRSTAPPPQALSPNWPAEPPTGVAPTFPLPGASVAPRETEPAPATPSASDLSPSGGNAVDAMATAPLADAGGAEGQLFLDGSLLGRWIIDHLSREADRPPAGGTSFDPRQARHAFLN